MDYYINGLVKSLADYLVYWAPLDADKKHFFLSPETHIVQTFWAYLICLGFIYASTFGTIEKPKWPAPRRPPTIIEKAIRTILTINIILQIIYKYLRGWRVLTYMLQPCHAASALYLYAMYSSNHKRATRVFQISLHYMFFTTLAIALPDLSQLHLPFEQANFWVQHYILLLVPLYLLAVQRFELAPTWALTSLSVGLGLLFHFLPQLVAGLLSGVNVNYMLWPPPGIPPWIANEHYRITLTLIFIPMGIATGYFLPKMVLKMQREEDIKYAHRVAKHNKSK